MILIILMTFFIVTNSFVFLLAFILLAIPNCYSQENVTISRSQESIIKQQAVRLVKYLPDHGMENTCKEGFDPLFFEMLTHAFSIPSNGIGEIGSEEWLYYFVSGNDGCECTNHPVKILTCNMIRNETAYVELNYLHRNHELTLNYNGFDWVISDFDNVGNRLMVYIKDMRLYFLSSEWASYVSKFLEDDDWKFCALERLQEIDEYFRKYPSRNEIKKLQPSLSAQ